MCSNYFLEMDKAKLAAFYGVELPEELGKSDVFPGYQGTILERDEDGHKALRAMQWGFLPYWAKTPKDKPQPFNARGEGVASSKMFGQAFAKRRCLVPATAFTEWKTGEDEKKHRYKFTPGAGGLFSFAGIWTTWSPKDAKAASDALESYTIITTGPNAFMTEFHDRMPVILAEADWERWLSPKTTVAEAEKLLLPFDGELKATLNERKPAAKKTAVKKTAKKPEKLL